MMLFAAATLESYLLAYNSNKIAWPRRCSDCGAWLHKHGHYLRKVEVDGKAYLCPIQRMYCPKCRRTHAVLPSIFIPRHSLMTSERERIAMGALGGVRGAA